MPFTVEQFFAVFGRYNETIWPLQVALCGVAIAALFLLIRRGPWSDAAISGMLAVLWGWMAIAYHFVFFSRINAAAWIFGAGFLAAALWFVWVGVAKGRLHFAVRPGLRAWTGAALVVYALVLYPLIGYAAGHRYPEVPTFGLPCPTTIFTVGLLMFVAAPLPRSVLVVPVLWSMIGSVAAFELGVVQDYGLSVAGLVALGATLVPQRNAQPTAA